MTCEAYPSDRPVVEMRDVTVRFPRQIWPAVHEVNLSVGCGEHVVVLGCSGSGKSTVLEAIAGVIPQSVNAYMSGTVSVAGIPTEHTSVVERSRYVTRVIQDPAAAVCLPDVEGELALTLENHAVHPGKIDSALAAALDSVGAGHLRHRETATLSGGESQRIALAASLVTQPHVMLLDEPTSMLDPRGVASVRAGVDTVLSRSRAAMILVEHRLDEWAGSAGVVGLPGRAVALNEAGEVMATGPTHMVMRQYARTLLASGSWLPLDAELYALTGIDDGLNASANHNFLHSLAANGCKSGKTYGTSGPVLMTTHDLAVSHRSPRRTYHRRRGTPNTIVSGLNLALRGGQVTALIGINGTGKTTLLLTLAGLLPAHSGHIETRERSGMVFQNPEHQFLAPTVRREIMVGLPSHNAARIADQQLREHRLTHVAQTNPFRLSGGEKRRLSLAAMLAHGHGILMADEPTLGLDRRDTVTVSAMLRTYADNGGAVAIASHDLRLVAQLADQIVVLSSGRAIAQGPTEQIISDTTALHHAGLQLPPLVSWLLTHTPQYMRHVLYQLDSFVTTETDNAKDK